MAFQTIFGVQTFIGLDKKEYTITPLTIPQLARFVSWVQYKPYRDACSAELSEEICEKILEKCETGLVEEEYEEGKFKKFPISFASTGVTSALFTEEGSHKLAHLSICIEHPELKEINEFNKIIDKNNFADLARKSLIANGVIVPAEEKEEEPEKNL